MSDRGFRPLSGVSAICARLMATDRSELSVATCTASACTSTVVDTSPTVRLISGKLILSWAATGIAFWAQIVILRNLSAVSTNLTLMAVPVVGVVSSAILLGEEVTTSLAIGLMLVIIGVAMNLLTDRTTVEEIQPSEVV